MSRSATGKFVLSCLAGAALSLSSCTNDKDKFIAENTDFAVRQTKLMLENAGEPVKKDNYPRSMNNEGKLVTTSMYDWTPGFFPGSLWYLYELTGDETWKNQAEKWTLPLEQLKTFTGHHDLGFMVYCSYGNAYRLSPKPEYKDIIVQSAGSLATRFSEKTRTIKSWNRWKSWDGAYEGFYPVIADNMMNLEMLLKASEISDNPQFREIAIAHADATIKNHLREDYGSYHVVDYDTLTGAVNRKGTAQGYSDNSTWARGQAWTIYGFTMMYRQTQEPRYLSVAIKTADYYLNHLPEDLVPPWDFNIGEPGYTPDVNSNATTYKEKLKDASAAAIVCSALFDLGELSKDKKYTDQAVKMLHSLASPAYRAALGTNANFLLMHSVGSVPHKGEMDKPLVYADYYFLEALVRYKKLKS